ncbi:MAG TPA: HAMP domain-containing sensor histidine kinase, partial [Herpetosiphonaceae bacterium]
LLARFGPAEFAEGALSGGTGVTALAATVMWLAYAIGYLLVRGGAGFWLWWNELRQRRLLWALTHDQTIALFGLTILLGASVALVSLMTAINSGGLSALVNQISVLAILGSFFLALSTIAVIGLLPLMILLSALLVRRIIRRIEQLAAATAAFRAGDYAARVPVSGRDELAGLQHDFNRMAAELERTLRDLQAERDRVAELLRARRELVASVSHELRTPVATMRGYLDAALRQADALPPQTAGDLRVMEHEVLRLQRLINDLFTLASAEVGKVTLLPAPVDLAAAARRAVEMVAPLAWQSGKVEVTAQAAAELPPALADADRVEQILRNLIQNAIRHTPPGGIVAVAAEEIGGRPALRVSDTGSGIDPADLPHIWERFYRADDARRRDFSGAGLGLALVRELAEQMGGSATVESELGRGSSFTVVLPRADNAAPLPIATQLAEPAPVARR